MRVRIRPPTAALDVERVRREFPALDPAGREAPVAYLDNASTTQKPRAVIDAVTRAYEQPAANVHRGVHRWSVEATREFEAARTTVATHLGVPPQEVIFTRGTTESLNLVAQAWGRSHVKPGDIVALTELEHHSNLVPWQMLVADRGARLEVIRIDDRGQIDVDDLERVLALRPRVVAVTHVSNALGTVVPVADIAQRARAVGAVVVVDGAQAAPHLKLDLPALGCDFYALSSHKMYGPTGVGVLWGRTELLDAMPPWQGGGDMIASVSWDRTEVASAPAKFEAGTPPIAGVLGFAAAIAFVQSLGLEAIAAHERALVDYATTRLDERSRIRRLSLAPEGASVVSFDVRDVHPHDVGSILDATGVAVRSGHHCAEPLMRRLGLPGTVRVSFGLYNTLEEVDRLMQGLKEVERVFP